MEETAVVTVEDVAQAVEAIEDTQTSPILGIEKDLSSFISNVFEMVKEEDDYQRAIQAETMKRLPTLKNSELIALGATQSTNMNDALSKTLSPLVGLLTAAQQAEMARQQKEAQSISLSQTNIHGVQQTAPHDVLVGMKALSDLLQAAANVKKVD